MIDGQVFAGAAILAGKAVAAENILPAKHYPTVRNIDVAVQANHGRRIEATIDASQAEAFKRG